VPAGIPDETAVFAEPLAAALEIQEQVAIGPRDRVVVVGDGKLGNLVAQTLALSGCALTVIGRHASKLALLAARGIATTAESGLPPGEADVAVECTGNAEGLELARRAVRPRGTIVLKSTYRGRTSLDVSRLVVDEITLVGSRCGPFVPPLPLRPVRSGPRAPGRGPGGRTAPCPRPLSFARGGGRLRRSRPPGGHEGAGGDGGDASGPLTAVAPFTPPN